ncbi:MAG: YtxH domain-containing protein [Alistipes sp.]|nr:YtxH domain-containing protein [Alistipes sp.]
MKNTTMCVASLLGGLIIGSALAMLFTPQSGPELRHHIKGFVDDEVSKLKTKADAVHDKLKAEIEAARCKCGAEEKEA